MGMDGQAGSTAHELTIVSNGVTVLDLEVGYSTFLSYVHDAVMKTNESSGIIEISSNTFDIFPNPAKEKVMINFEGNSTNYTISLLDISSRVLNSNVYTNLKGAQNIEMSLKGIESGNYIVSIASENGVVNKNIVVE